MHLGICREKNKSHKIKLQEIKIEEELCSRKVWDERGQKRERRMAEYITLDSMSWRLVVLKNMEKTSQCGGKHLNAVFISLVVFGYETTYHTDNKTTLSVLRVTKKKNRRMFYNYSSEYSSYFGNTLLDIGIW